ASALLAVVDAVRRMLADVEKNETDGEADFSALIETLERLRAARGVPAPSLPPAPAKQHPAPTFQTGGARRENTLHSPTLVASLAMSESIVPESESRSSAISDSSIRVDVGLLDKLMTLVGELVLARNQIMQFSASQEGSPFLGTVQ